MKSAWLHRTGQPRVVVFFAGWAMDETPFLSLKSSELDVVVYYDYLSLDDVPFAAEIEAYSEMNLAAWSLGCAVANITAQERRWRPTQSLAINGTVIPEDDLDGIPGRWLTATSQGLTNGGWEKFIRRMCPDSESRAAFDTARPHRNLRDAAEELETLRRLQTPLSCLFTTALVGEADRIIVPENQRRCWQRYGVPVRAIDAGHYPFHLWRSWEEVLACAG